MSFICDWTGERTSVRYFIPTRRDCQKGSGTFIDLNCAMAHLHVRVLKGKIKATTAARYEKWICDALGRKEAIKRAPSRQCFKEDGPVVAKSLYKDELCKPTAICRETTDDVTRRVVMQTDRVASVGGVQPAYVMPDCSVRLQFKLKATKPGIRDNEWRDLDDWQGPLRNARYHYQHIMAARLNKTGVELYPTVQVPDDLVRQCVPYGAYSITRAAIFAPEARGQSSSFARPLSSKTERN